MDNQKDRKGKDKRNFVRVEYSIPVVLETSDMTVPSAEGVLCDVSAQGVMLTVNNKLNTGLFVKIHLKMKKKCSPFMGHVQWVKEAGSEYTVGVMFDESHAEQNDRVVDLMTREIISEIRRRQKSLEG